MRAIIIHSGSRAQEEAIYLFATLRTRTTIYEIFAVWGGCAALRAFRTYRGTNTALYAPFIWRHAGRLFRTAARHGIAA